jgi:hypothetical protein
MEDEQKPQPTPGPWSIGTSLNAPGILWINSPGFESICDLYSRDRVGEGLHLRPFPNAEANARLIAAAPDLLAALKSARDIAREALREHETWDEESVARVGKLLAALAGELPGYRADADAIHAAVKKATEAP